jgi:hypothetical protein
MQSQSPKSKNQVGKAISNFMNVRASLRSNRHS